MTTIEVVQEEETTLKIETSNLFLLLDAPVGPDKGRQMLSIFKTLTADAHIDAEEAARECRRAFFLLDNLSYRDAEDYSNERNEYASWFYDGRKKLIKIFKDEAERLDPTNGE